MKAYYQEPNSMIYQGHALNVLRELESNSVDCVITSPPYWGLRSYKTEPIIWGDNHCEHEWGKDIFKAQAHHAGETNPGKEGYTKDKDAWSDKQGSFCLKCGAWKGELGLEPTIELYINHLLLIFDEVKRVLKKTGSLWVNIGDSYAGSGCGTNDYRTLASRSLNKSDAMFTKHPPQQKLKDIPAKSLCLIPERFAIGMVERGWILRNNIIWSKRNPMPESVKDRFTGSYEVVYFFVKSNSIQYWTNPVTGQITDKQPLGTKGEWGIDWVYRKTSKKERNRVSLWQGHTYWFEQQFEPIISEAERGGGLKIASMGKEWGGQGLKDWRKPEHGNRNKRDVWEINTQPYPEAHFAVFPEKLIETPILAGCPSAICKKCGKAREKIYETTGRQGSNASNELENLGRPPEICGTPEIKDLGYSDCGCNTGFEPGIVLDPFAGSGTTGAVAKRLGRKYIGIDISEAYCKLHVKRLRKIPLALELV